MLSRLSLVIPNMEIKRDDPARRKSFRAKDTTATIPVPQYIKQDTGHVSFGKK